jgi:hypothetical protein
MVKKVYPINAFGTGAAIIILVGSWIFLTYNVELHRFVMSMFQNLPPSASFGVMMVEYTIWLLIVGIPIAVYSRFLRYYIDASPVR